MKERIYLLIDLDSTDPEDAVFAAFNNHEQAQRTINKTPERNLVIAERNVYGRYDEIEQDLDNL